MTDQITPPAPEHALPPLPPEELFFTEDLGLGDTAHYTGYTANQMRDYARAAMAAATPAPAPADHATVEQWEAALTAVMPSDFKDWHQNSRREWPNIAAHVIGNLRQREDEAWATVERLSANAPAPAVPTLPAHQRTAPARIYLHDGDDEHTELFPAGMDDGVTWSSDNATGLGVPYVRADLIRSSVAADTERLRAADVCARLAWMMENGAGEGCAGERLRQAQRMILGGDQTPGYMTEAMRTAPQAPQQAECPECIEQARLLGAGSEREAALMAEVDRLKRAQQQAEHIPTVEDINAQDWAGMDGTTAWHLIDRHGEDWAHIGRLMAAWLAANQAQGMGAAPDASIAVELAAQYAARITGLEPDAARWRFLRDRSNTITVCECDIAGEWIPVHPLNVAATVDAAMAAESATQVTGMQGDVP